MAMRKSAGEDSEKDVQAIERGLVCDEPPTNIAKSGEMRSKSTDHRH